MLAWFKTMGGKQARVCMEATGRYSLAVALALLHYAPWLGLVFLFISVWISLGAVVGRYHYALDVLLGAVTALAVFLACYPYLT